MPAIALCNLNDLGEGESRGFDPFAEGRDLIFAVRRGNTVRVYRNRCPHQGSSMPWRRSAYLNSDHTRIVCSVHGAQFDIDSGNCVLGAALGQSLERIETRIDESGVIEARLPEPAS
ncbi:MAG TPA: Rieske (2Fe-2S) protein [Woeseiaceae bacterium]|nr:Rieske (2Fe-2S) protein [Woeseiaceae bacterium]